MSRAKIDYGIYLGTLHSVLARVDDGVAKVFNIDRSEIVPSCVAYLPNGSVRVGTKALKVKGKRQEFKRDMGTDAVYEVADGKEVTPEDCSSEVLKKLANAVTDETFKSVVITVPAAFRLPQVDATKRAAKMAGFEQVEILMEPVAAAFAFGSKKKIKNGKFVVFDFGVKRFEVSLLDIEEGLMTVVDTVGDNRLGGLDLNRRIITAVLLPQLKMNYTLNEEIIRELEGYRLKEIAEELMNGLEQNDSYDVLTSMDELGNDANGEEMEIDQVYKRDEVIGHMRPIFQKAIDITKNLLECNNLSAEDITALYLVGGPTQIPMFRSMIEEQLMKPDWSLDPMTAIAEGAALYASTINNDIDDHGAVIGTSDDEPDAQVMDPARLKVDYESTSNSDREPVSILRLDTKENLSATIKRSDGTWESEKAPLDAVINVELSGTKVNSFRIDLYNESNDFVPCTPNEFNIIPGIAVDGGSPLAYNIGMEVLNKKKQLVFQSFVGLEKDKRLPATGRTVGDLFTQEQIRPGNTDDSMPISIYQAEAKAECSRAKRNHFVTTIHLNGSDVPELIPEGTRYTILLKIDISQNMVLEVEFPAIGWTYETGLQWPPSTQVQKAQVDELLEEADRLITKLKNLNQKSPHLDNLVTRLDDIQKNYEQSVDQDGINQVFDLTKKLLRAIDDSVDDLINLWHENFYG